jgi:hypothetical protein
MKSDSIKQFVALRESLQQERTALLARLAEINRALGTASPPAADASDAAPAKRGRPPGSRGRGLKRMKNPMSLREAIAMATKKKPLDRHEILAAIAKLGYRFATSNPMNTLCSVLYAKGQYTNTNGKFAPAK